MSPYVEVRNEGEVFVVTMNDAKRRNALSLEMRQALYDRLSELLAEPKCRAIVLTGANGQFCAGSDVSQMSVANVTAGRQRLESVQRVIRMIVSGPKPVVAAVEGAAAGAGVAFAAGADYVVAATNAKFAGAFLRAGVIPDMGSLWTVPQRMGLGEAKRFFCMGKTLSGEEAARLRLVDQAVEPGKAVETAVAVAHEFSVPPQTFALYKNALANRATSFEGALAAEVDFQSMLFQTKDQQEAVKSFLEKRKPVFTNQ